MNTAVRMETKILPRPIPCTHCRDQPLGADICVVARLRPTPVAGSDNEAMKAAAAKATQEKEAAEAKVAKAKESRAQIIAEAKAGSHHRTPCIVHALLTVSSRMRCLPPHSCCRCRTPAKRGTRWPAVCDVEWWRGG
eukprot:COSAG01_NODE_4504_length_4970_cov_4.822008_5_plen_137_part_00